MRALSNGLSWAGLAAGPAAWAVTSQIGYSLADWQCLSGSQPAPWISFLGVLVGAAGAMLSWRALADDSHGPAPPRGARTRRFLASVSLGIGLVFVLTMLLQLAAALIFGGCEL